MKTRINLVPADRRSFDLINYEKTFFSIVVIVLLGFGSLYLAVKYKVNKQNQYMAQLKVKRKKLEKNLSRMELHENTAKSEDAKAKLISEIVGDRASWSDVFKEISLVVPKQTWLVGFAAQSFNSKFQFHFLGRTASQKTMAKFFSKLESSYYFNDIQLYSSNLLAKMEPELYEFEFGNFKSPNFKSIASKKTSKFEKMLKGGSNGK